MSVKVKNIYILAKCTRVKTAPLKPTVVVSSTRFIIIGPVDLKIEVKLYKQITFFFVMQDIELNNVKNTFMIIM